MDLLKSVFDTSVNMMSDLFSNASYNWGIFGGFIIAFPIMKKVANIFNKLKS